MLALVLAATLSAPNVIFISADTLRADHLGAYGYAYPTSPNLDALAAQGRVFEDIVCEIPLTGPSFASMFSSRYPRMTGATRNALPLPESIPTITEIFQTAGYHTICVQSNWTLKRKLSGLHRGFDVFDDEFQERRWGFMKAERDGDDVTRIAIDLIAKRDTEKPLFAWIHYSDPHAPYTMHRKFNVSKEFDHDDRRIEKITRQYDSEIAYMDNEIGRLLEHLPKEDTFIVFTADHGESLWEHEYLGHGRRIHQTGMHIPLIVTGPNIDPARSTAPGSGIDIGPTLLGLANLSPAAGMLGADLLKTPPVDSRIRVVETYGGAVPNLPGAKALMADSGPQRQGVLHEGWKLILGARNPELFNLVQDPAELKNLATNEADRVARLTSLIETWSNQTNSIEGAAPELTQADQEALEALGYIE